MSLPLLAARLPDRMILLEFPLNITVQGARTPLMLGINCDLCIIAPPMPSAILLYIASVPSTIMYDD